MERLIRSHPSAIMVSLINEPFAVKEKKGHRHLYREELEDFFQASTYAIQIQNPDRVIKHVEGDYDPPTRTGLSDFHCYTMWYTNHALPIGKLHRGYLPAIKRGWKTGCGEYGTEGLDPSEVMWGDYPKTWLPADADEPWTPERIAKAQTYSMHGDWYEEPSTLPEWIAASQEHQAVATQMMTDALRRRADLVVSTAVHLLIDAWPSGWMKALVDHRRKPKPAYFAFARSLKPVRVHLRSDRRQAYTGDRVDVEAWVLNDTPEELAGHRMIVTVREREKDWDSFAAEVSVSAVSAECSGLIPVVAPPVADREAFWVDATLIDANGKRVDAERLQLESFAPEVNPITELFLDDEHQRIADNEGLIGTQQPNRVLIRSGAAFERHQEAVLQWVKDGARAVLLLAGQKENGKVTLGDDVVDVKPLGQSVTFLARSRDEPLTRDFGPKDFSFWYNAHLDRIDAIADHYLDFDGLTPLLFTYQKPEFFRQATGGKRKLPVVGKLSLGKGELVFSVLRIDGFWGKNPVLDRFLIGLLT